MNLISKLVTLISHSPRQRDRKRRGMSLIEIMVGIAILAMISAGVAIYVIPQFSAAKVKQTIIDMGTIENALKLYYAKKGKYPDTGTGLKALVDSQDLERQPKDPWGNDYMYMLEAGKPVIISYGADGQAGGSGPDTDINSKNPPKD